MPYIAVCDGKGYVDIFGGYKVDMAYARRFATIDEMLLDELSNHPDRYLIKWEFIER